LATWTVFSKELTELRRDPKALLVSLGLPALLMPLMFALLASGLESTSVWLEEGVPVAVTKGASELEELLRQGGTFVPYQGEATEDRLLSGEVALLLIPEAGGASVVYDSRSQRSLAAADALVALLEKASRSPREGEKEDSFRVVRRSVAGAPGSSSSMLLSMVLPILLLVACAVTPLAAAADFGAGEKERGSLEPLLTTPMERGAFLLGKQGATWVMGIAGALSFFTGSALAYVVAPGLLGGELDFGGLGVVDLILLLLLTALLAFIFSAAELALSFLARSIREAHSFFLPLLIIAVSAGYATFGIDPVHSSLWNYAIPLANIPLTVKAIILHSATPQALLLTFGVGIVLAGLLLLIGLRMLERESLLFRV
jgi:sodium transport system permease protein